MRKAVLAASLIGTVLLCATPAQAADTAGAVLKDASGKEVGRAMLTDMPSGVLIRLDLTSAPEGEHAFHIHAVGTCEPPDFKSAGPHFNPDRTKHGLENAEGPHAGDMPNLHVPADGRLSIEVLNVDATLSGNFALLDEDGAAFVLHAGPDDYQTDPSGNAGGRIACGVIAP